MRRRDGRGFAVVADEVRKLAERTAAATNEIATLATTIQGETRSTREQMDDGAQRTASFGDEGTTATEGMRTLFELSRCMKGAIAASALRCFVEVAKIDHLVCKFEVYRVIMGISQKTIGDFEPHTTCRLGKWYYGRGARVFFQAAGVCRDGTAASCFPEAGLAALATNERGDLAAYSAHIDEMEAASLEVIAALEKIASSAEGVRRPYFVMSEKRAVGPFENRSSADAWRCILLAAFFSVS